MLSPSSPSTLYPRDVMRLTVLCVYGSLLAFSSLSWTTGVSGEGDLLVDKEFGPCEATLQLEGPCRPGQEETTCPYLLSLPPLTLHVPSQLRELEKIMKDLQDLKDDVDQLRRMCADCTVSQTERECGRQTEKEHVMLNENADSQVKDERKWVNEREPERAGDVKEESGRGRVNVEETVEGDGEKRTHLEDRGRNKWEAERESNKRLIKENEEAETLLEMTEKDGKTHKEGAKARDKLGQTKVPAAGGKRKTEDMAREKTPERSLWETEINKKNYEKGDSKGDRKDVLESGKERNVTTNIKKKEETAEGDQHAHKETEEDKGNDGIKMSEEREQHWKDREKKEGMKVEQNEDKPKETINREEGAEGDRGTDKVVQSIQRDTDGELESNKASERTDRQTPPSTVSFITTRHKSMDSNGTTTLTLSPPPPLSSPHLVTDVDEAAWTGAHGLPSHSTDHPDPDAAFKTTSGPTTTGRLGVNKEQQRTRAMTRFTSTASPSSRTHLQGRVRSTVATTINSTPREDFYTTTVSGVTARSLWTTKDTKTGGKPRPVHGPNPAEKHKHGIKPEAVHKLKNPKNDHKQDRAPLPDKRIKTDQKLKPSLQKPTTDQKPKPVKGQQHAHNPKPEHRATLNNLTADLNLKNNPMLKRDKDLTSAKKPKYHQKSISSVHRPTTVNATLTSASDTNPQTEPSSKPERNQNNHRQIVKPEPKQKPHKNVKGKEKTKPDLRADHTTDSGSTGRAKVALKPSNRATTELLTHSKESDSNQDKIPGQKRDSINTPSDQKIPVINPDPKPGHIPKLNQRPLQIDSSKSTKPNVKPKTSQPPQKNQGLKAPGPSQTPDLYPKSVPDQNHKAESNKTSKPRPPPRRGHTFKPGATSVQRPQPAEQHKSNPNTKTDSNPEISGTTSDGIQNPQVNMPPPSGSVKQSAEMTHSPGDAEFSPSTKESITASPKTLNSLDTFPLLHTLVEGFTVNPNSRTTSDLGPQTAGQHSSIPMTTRPNKIIHGILTSVIPSTSPGSTPLKSIIQAELPLHVVEAAPEQTLILPLPSPRAETTITPSPDTRSTTTDPSGPRVPVLDSSRAETTITPSPDTRSTTADPSGPRVPELDSSRAETTITLSPDTRSTTADPSGPKVLERDSSRTESTITLSPDPRSAIADPSGPRVPVLDSSRAEATITLSPDTRSATADPSGPRVPVLDSSTPSAHELRVKINQVAAFSRDSQSSDTRTPDKRPTEHPEERYHGHHGRGDTGMDLKKWITSKASTALRRDCADHLLQGGRKSGVYLVTPDVRSKSFSVFCDMELAGGGWTLLQLRQDGSVSFNRTWAEYRAGFGEVGGREFWLGNNMIHLLTRDRDVVLRVELEDFEGVMEYAEYEQFKVASERLRYRLTVGGYSGTAGNALRFNKMYDHNSRAFTTPDRDNDRYPSGNCGAYYSSGWWFDACMAANLNGRYYVGKYKGIRDGIFWGTWHNITSEYYPTNDRQSFKTVRMMIRPKGFAP